MTYTFGRRNRRLEGRRATHPSPTTRADVPTCRPEETVGETRPRMVDAGWEVCVVVDCDAMAIGRLRNADLDTDLDRPAAEAMESGPSTVRPNTPLQPLVQRMQERDAPQGKLSASSDEAVRLLA